MERHFFGKNEPQEPAPSPERLGATFLEGISPSMRAVEVVIRELAQSEVPVLLLAEAGAGKRTIARRIHETWGRSAQAFRIVGCATLTSESFQGKGSGALFSEGTVFLEEIVDLNSACQVKLLEALPQVEENGSQPIEARLICGSARDLEAEVRSGRFRE